MSHEPHVQLLQLPEHLDVDRVSQLVVARGLEPLVERPATRLLSADLEKDKGIVRRHSHFTGWTSLLHREQVDHLERAPALACVSAAVQGLCRIDSATRAAHFYLCDRFEGRNLHLGQRRFGRVVSRSERELIEVARGPTCRERERQGNPQNCLLTGRQYR